MKKITGGMTIIETLIGVSLLAIVLGGIFGALIVIRRYAGDGIAMAKSQAIARIVIEKMARPIRHGESFIVSDGGDTLTLTRYDGTLDTFTFTDNTLEQNENPIGTSIYRIPEGDETIPIFKLSDDLGEDVSEKLIEINFLVRNRGVSNQYQEVRISTVMKLRN